MPVMLSSRLNRALKAERGFTMIITIGVMFVSGLLLIAAFTAANGDIHLSHKDTTQKQAYYAALAGIQEYEYKLQVNPDYWETCETPPNTLSAESGEKYEVALLAASSSKVGSKCLTSKPFESMIESKGALANTFRIESTGYAGTDKRTLVATFQVTGFLNFVYYTDYEDEDPGLYNPKANCELFRSEKRSSECQLIVFIEGDNVNGPMHTNDASDICGKVSFGRASHSPADVVEMRGGPYSEGCGSLGSYTEATYNTTTKSYIKGTELVPPQSDTTLGAYVEKEDEFTGVTRLVLNGTANTISVTNSKKEVKTINWPSNGLIYVHSNKSLACGYTFQQENSDTPEEETQETNCGNVYVSGTYSSSLTIGAENDLIINGSVYPTSVAGKLGSAPSGTTTLGLIANNYVRVYHPVTEEHGNCSNATGSLTEPWIYAAILATTHSFLVDNYSCGAGLKNLNVYGAIAQKFRGIVGQGSSGYIKNYVYDERLAVDEPPYFLSPLNAGWKVARETAPKAG
jgi:type II secretory pathway pseudopilin PulG